MEYLDIYDEDRKWRGFSRARSEAYRPGEYHLIVHVCLMNEDGEMLIQQRAGCVSRWAGRWDLTIGGHVLFGEEPVQAAIREMREELGLEAAFENARIVTRRMENRFDDTFVISVRNLPGYDGDADGLHGKIVFQKEEVQAVRWASREEVMKMIADGRFLDYESAFIDRIYGGE